MNENGVARLLEAQAPAGLARKTSAEQEAQTFWRLRTRMIRTTVRHMLHTARLRIALVSVLSLVFWIGLYLLFYEGFQFLFRYVDTAGFIHAQTVHAIYNVFFASLMVMLVFSSGIILYGGLYRSPETRFLLTLPVRTERIVLYKFQESLLFSSWGFFLLGSPMLIAYGVVAGAAWYYYALLLPFMVAFAYIPCAIGALLCLLIVYRIPKIRIHAVSLAAVATIVCAGVVVWSLVSGPESNILTANWFQETIARLQFSEHRLLPSWWLSNGLLEAARTPEVGSGELAWIESVMFLALLLSNAMLLHVLTLWVGGRVFRASFSGLAGDRTSRKRTRVALVDRLAMRLTAWLPYQVRLLIVKDLRIFRRDPVQWSQFLIFFGLLALYFVNIRRFTYDVNYTGWVNMVSFLNLAVVGLILSTFTTRFIFPMISLEGSRFWILGLLPIERDLILWGKFIFAAAGSILPCTVLILLSDLMLRISPLVLAIHQLTCITLCFGLSGIAVGLGARMPDLREQSPSKIAAGFGGTLNLVLSAMYIVAVVLLTALPCHFYLAATQSDLGGAGALDPDQMRLWLILGTAGAVLLGILATAVPLCLGFRAFRRMEF